MNYEKAETYWRRKPSKPMRKELLQKTVDDFIAKHNVCALATGYGTYVRVTPLEYTYINHKFYIFSEGGMKFRGLKDNKNVSLTIFEDMEKGLHSVQIAGVARIVEPWSEEYNTLLEYKHITQVMKKMPEAMPLICMEPTEMDILDSDLKKEGYGARQHMRCREE